MKTKQVLAVMITSLFLIYGCSNNDYSVEGSELASKSSSLSKSASESHGSSEIHRAYPKEEAEVLATFGAIATNITLGAGLGTDTEFMNQLIGFHDYDGYTFTEFNYDFNGVGHSYTAAENEATERTLFGTMVNPGGVQKFAAVPGTLKIAVYYGNVANLTFISDFDLIFKGDGPVEERTFTVNNLITLLFVKTNGDWKMVHEHHSPLTISPSTGDKPINILSEFDPSSASNGVHNGVHSDDFESHRNCACGSPTAEVGTSPNSQDNRLDDLASCMAMIACVYQLAVC